jgi:uroporphyrinogen-III synthase
MSVQYTDKPIEMHTVIYTRSDDKAMKIAITRLKGKEGKDKEYCSQYGHECIIVSPLTAKVTKDRVSAFVKAAENNEFDCIFFTSALPAQIIAPLLSHWPRVIAIGPQTARVLKSYRIECETLPTYYSRDFVPYLGAWIKGKRIGIPRADVPNPGLIEAIARAGGVATEIRCYSLVPTGQVLDLQNADAVLFTSAMSFRQAVWKRRPGLLVIAIGDVTASVMIADGVRPDVTGDGSLEGTLQKLNEYLNTAGLE